MTMQCSLCKREGETGLKTELVTGKLQTDSGVTKTYSGFQPLSLWFCEDCWRVYSAKREADILTSGLVAIAFGVMFLIGGALSKPGGQQMLCGGIAVLAILGGIMTAIYGAMKKAKPTDWSSKHPNQEKPGDVFKLFENIIPAIVHQIKGESVDFWTAENWKDWMNKSGNKVITYRSRPPSEDATEDNIKKDPVRIQQALDKGDFKSALNLCREHQSSAFFSNLEGTILEKMGRKAEAITAYSTAVLYNPGLVEAAENLARLTSA